MRKLQYMPDSFLPRLEELMQEKDIKKVTLSKELGVSPNTVTDWVNDTRIMTTVNFFKLCEYFDVSALWLYGLTDKRSRYKGD